MITELLRGLYFANTPEGESRSFLDTLKGVCMQWDARYCCLYVDHMCILCLATGRTDHAESATNYRHIDSGTALL